MKILLVLLSCFFCLSACKSKSRNEPPSTIGKRQKENHILPKKIDDTIKNTYHCLSRGRYVVQHRREN